jgi:hypothetical protein
MLDWPEIKSILGRHGYARNTPAATPFQGWLLGNADMGATIFGPSHKLTFRLSKLDLWDARWNEENYNHPLPLTPFKEFVFGESGKLQSGESIDMPLNDSWQGRGTTYPCLRMAAQCPRLAIQDTQALQKSVGHITLSRRLGRQIMGDPFVRCVSRGGRKYRLLARSSHRQLAAGRDERHRERRKALADHTRRRALSRSWILNCCMLFRRRIHT